MGKALRNFPDRLCWEVDGYVVGPISHKRPSTVVMITATAKSPPVCCSNGGIARLLLLRTNRAEITMLEACEHIGAMVIPTTPVPQRHRKHSRKIPSPFTKR